MSALLPAPPSQNVPSSLTLTAHAEPLGPPGILPRKGDPGLYHRDRSQALAPPQDRPHWSHLQTHHRTTPSQLKINAVKQKNKNQKPANREQLSLDPGLWVVSMVTGLWAFGALGPWKCALQFSQHLHQLSFQRSLQSENPLSTSLFC